MNNNVDILIKKIRKKTSKQMIFEGIIVALGSGEITVQEAINRINKLDNE